MINKVLLHDRKSRRYYAGPGYWVKQSSQAADLGDISSAVKAFSEEGLTYAEILLDNGELPQAPPHPGAVPGDRPRRRR